MLALDEESKASERSGRWRPQFGQPGVRSGLPRALDPPAPISRGLGSSQKGGDGCRGRTGASGVPSLCHPHRPSSVLTTHLPAMRALLLISTICLLARALAAEVKKPAAAAAPGTAEKLSPKAATLAERSAGLAFSLYQAMAKDQAVENILLSPVVVASSLGLVSLGGKAATASQAKAVLSAEQLRDDEVHAGLGELLRSLSNSRKEGP